MSEVPLKTTEDVAESRVALARRVHAAAHTNEPLGLHRKVTLAANGWPPLKLECVTRTSSRGHALIMIWRGKLLLLRIGGNWSILFVEDAESTHSDFMMDDSLAAFADTVDAKFLINSTCVIC